MNRYPLWKNLLVFGIVLVSTIVALAERLRRRRGRPGLAHGRRGDGRAGARAGADDADGRRRRRSCPPRSRTRRRSCGSRRRRCRRRARDVLTEALPNHVVALTLAPRTPGWLKALGLEPMLLGLDLRGGVHFLYQVDLDAGRRAVPRDLRDRPAHAVPRARDPQRRPRRRHDACRSRSSSRPTWTAPRRSSAQLDTGDQLLQLGQLTSRLIVDRAQIDGRPGFNVRLTEAAIRERQDFAIQQNTVTLRNRVNELGVAEAVVQRQGLDRILVELPGIQDPATAKRVLGSTATLEFHLVDQENDAVRGRAPRPRAARLRAASAARGRLADPAAARHHRLRRSAHRRHAGVRAGPARRQRPARRGRRDARCSTRRSTTSAG